MKIAALFVCANDHLYDAVNTNRERLIPEALRKRWEGFAYSVIPLKPQLGADETEIINTIENIADNFDGIILLVPPSFADLLARFRHTLFVVDYSPPKPLTNLQNQMSALLQRAFRDFSILVNKVSDMKYKRSMLLPLNDFKAPVMDSTRDLFSDIAGENQFSRALDAILRDFRKLQVPTRVSKDEVHPVYVDEEGKRFDRGREKHARAGTASPPHDGMCGLSKAFRFGFVYPDDLHFNVETVGDIRKYAFYGCHPPHGSVYVKRASHANVFPNGDVT